MTDFWVMRLNAADAALAWPIALPLLATAIERSDGLFLPEDVHDLVTRPEAGTAKGWSLWLLGTGGVVQSAWVTKVEPYPRLRVLYTVFGGGTNIADWWDTAIAEMDKFAAEIGCPRLRCAGRRGWSRMGYRMIGHLHERKLVA